MDTCRVIQRVFMLSLCLASWSAASLHAAEQAGRETTNPTSKEDLNTVAAGSRDDTLENCLKRIPKIATTGQRLLAEQNCQAEQKTRESEQVAPHF